jgi:hypothetical protein
VIRDWRLGGTEVPPYVRDSVHRPERQFGQSPITNH